MTGGICEKNLIYAATKAKCFFTVPQEWLMQYTVYPSKGLVFFFLGLGEKGSDRGIESRPVPDAISLGITLKSSSHLVLVDSAPEIWRNEVK